MELHTLLRRCLGIKFYHSAVEFAAVRSNIQSGTYSPARANKTFASGGKAHLYLGFERCPTFMNSDW